VSRIPLVSVVVPVWRDADALQLLLADLARERSHQVQIIVVIAGVEAEAYDGLRAAYPWVVWTEGTRGRARQMNEGAARAGGAWLWFLHADSRLPVTWIEAFVTAHPGAARWGHFRFALDSPDAAARRLERLVAWRVRWLHLPYGDQGIFVRREVFEQIRGYQELPLMEDVDLVRRLWAVGRPLSVNLPLWTSARRWERDGWWRRSASNVALLALFFAGVSPARLAPWYERPAGMRNPRGHPSC
jgi:rSAM/selenodomain-associated transferase 2